MVDHRIYQVIVAAVESGKLRDPFRAADVRAACPGFAHHTYGTFLPKHRIDNPSGTSELFVQVSKGLYKLVRPLKYGL